MSRPFVAAVAILSCGAALTRLAQAEPYRPARDNEVLETLPRSAEPGATPMLRALRQLHVRDQSNLDVAVRLAQAQIDAARAAADPRFWGQAQATLGIWWTQESPPVPVLLLRAAIRQNRHEFDAAKADLQRVIAQQPGHAQAWLDLASLQQVTGDLANAAHSCERVVGSGAGGIGAVCRASLDALQGRGAQAYAALEETVAQDRLAAQPTAVRTWALTLLAELAERLGRNDDAERWYRQSLALDPSDAYTLSAYADFLLDRHRAADVTALIAAETPIDGLLLRRVQADRALGADAARAGTDVLAARFDALRERGDRVHRREESRFRLALAQEPAVALDLALENWAVQKEPLDARIVLEAALAANRPGAAAEVARWIRDTRLQDVRLDPLLQRVRAP
jgi:tetratricopeptide (TPR) repeat protein